MLFCKVLNNSCLWQLYAQIAASDEPSAQNNTKVAQCLQKAYRTATQGSWERDLTSCMRVTDVCVDLAEGKSTFISESADTRLVYGKSTCYRLALLAKVSCPIQNHNNYFCFSKLEPIQVFQLINSLECFKLLCISLVLPDL